MVLGYRDMFGRPGRGFGKRRRKNLASVVIACALATASIGTLSVLSAEAHAARSAAPCDSPFDPYGYSSTALNACGMRTFPLEQSMPLPDGGHSYIYDVDGLRTEYLVPPPGFDPRTASDAQLDTYGIPSRPTDAADLPEWQADYGDLQFAKPPPFLVETTTYAGFANPGTAEPGVPSDARNYYSDNWSGLVATGGRGRFSRAQTIYREPHFLRGCRRAEEVTWAGIGGFSKHSTLAQDGTLFNVPGARNHQAWTEIYPNQAIQPVPGVYGTVGGRFDALTQHIHRGYHFFVHDAKSHRSASFNVTGIGGYDGLSAEVIAERPSAGKTLTPLANFGTLAFYNAWANGSGSRHNLSRYNPHYRTLMTNGQGAVLADPNNIRTGDAGFRDKWHRCS